MPKGYYATLRRESGATTKTAWLAGPFRNHEDAKAVVRRTHDEAQKHDPRAFWDSFGTSSIDSPDPLPYGLLNQHLGLGVDESGFCVKVET